MAITWSCVTASVYPRSVNILTYALPASLSTTSIVISGGFAIFLQCIVDCICLRRELTRLPLHQVWREMVWPQRDLFLLMSFHVPLLVFELARTTLSDFLCAHGTFGLGKTAAVMVYIFGSLIAVFGGRYLLRKLHTQQQQQSSTAVSAAVHVS